MNGPSDPFDLQRFVDAQHDTYAAALAELRAGRKRSHWIWFVLPQLRGLGASAASQHYGLTGLAEARAYLAHPLLSARLIECVEAIGRHAAVPPDAVLGEIDAMKYRSCLTLFAQADAPGSVFEAALQRHFAGHPDPATLRLLGRDVPT